MPGHDIEFLKKQWNSAKPSADAARSLADISVSRLESARTLSHKVARHHLDFAILGLTLPALILWFSTEVTISLALIIAYSAFGLLCSGVNFYIYRSVKHNDYVSLPVIEAAQRVTDTKRFIGRWRIISIVLMIPVLVLFFIEISALGDDNLIYGGIIGGIVGAILGIVEWIKLNRQLRKLREMFSQEG